MKFRQFISTNPFQKSRDKKKKKSEAQQQHDRKDKSTPINSNSDISTAVYTGGQYSCIPTFERPPFRLGTNSAFFTNSYHFSIDEYGPKCIIHNEAGDCSPTVPRERSKIKTNPWIKHPVETQKTEAVLHCFDISKSADRSDFDLCRHVDLNSENFKSVNALDSVELRSRKDRTNTEISYRWSIISEGDISIDLDPGTIDSLSEQFKSLQYNCSFEYEDKLDLVLEDGFRRDHIYLSVQDLLSDSSDLTDSSSSSNVSMESTEDERVSSDAMATSSESESSLNDTLIVQKEEGELLCQNENEIAQQKATGMEESIDAGYSSLTRERLSSSESESSTFCSEYSSFGTENDSLDTRSDDSTYESDRISTGRTLPEVRLSLQEKIDQLRLEKFLVQQKIREAREEERIRQEERKKFKSQLMSQRKNALFKTLNDLKERLENQSVRLQRSYSTVLTMQRRFARRRATFHCS